MRDAQILTLPFQVPFDAKYNLRIYIFTSRFTKAKIPGIKFHSPQSVKYILEMPKTTIRTSVNASEFHRIMGYCFWSDKGLLTLDLMPFMPDTLQNSSASRTSECGSRIFHPALWSVADG